jgi:hypothetical protein
MDVSETDLITKAVEEKKAEFLAMITGKILAHFLNSLAISESFTQLEDINCPICFEFIVSCRVAVCGHTFCNFCLTECLLRKKVRIYTTE